VPLRKLDQEVLSGRQGSQLLKETKRFYEYPVLNDLAALEAVHSRHADIYSFSGRWKPEPFTSLRSIHGQLAEHPIALCKHLLDCDPKVREAR
jgi:hypothetical protein